MYMFSYLCYKCSNEKINVVFLTLNYVEKIYQCLPMYMFSYLCYKCSNEKINVVFLTLNYVEKI